MKTKHFTATYLIIYVKALRRVYKAADALEQWLGDNAGPTADYPIRITGDRRPNIEKMCRRLDALRKALIPLREVKP